MNRTSSFIFLLMLASACANPEPETFEEDEPWNDDCYDSEEGCGDPRDGNEDAECEGLNCDDDFGSQSEDGEIECWEEEAPDCSVNFDRICGAVAVCDDYGPWICESELCVCDGPPMECPSEGDADGAGGGGGGSSGGAEGGGGSGSGGQDACPLTPQCGPSGWSCVERC